MSWLTCELSLMTSDLRSSFDSYESPVMRRRCEGDLPVGEPPSSEAWMRVAGTNSRGDFSDALSVVRFMAPLVVADWGPPIEDTTESRAI